MTFYVDGEEQMALEGSAEKWKELSTFPIPMSTQVIAVKCLNNASIPEYGIVASVKHIYIHDFQHIDEEIFVTDRSWSCSGELESGWEEVDFQMGDNWKPASELEGIYYPDNSTEKLWWQFSPNTPIIWTDDSSDKTVYCRRTIKCK